VMRHGSVMERCHGSDASRKASWKMCHGSDASRKRHGKGVMERVSRKDAMEVMCHGSVMERCYGSGVSWKRHGKASWK